jgi:haloalkane dehalogenase
VISSQEPAKKFVPVLGRRMAYVEMGGGTPIVFLHGNPTSSYLWRNILPPLASLGRCLAPDLIGMGDSEKLEPARRDRYRFVEHRRYLDGFLETLGVEREVILVLHDWGSALGFDWANRHRAAVSGIAYMEAIVRPLTWSEWPRASRRMFEAFRSPQGEDMVLERNLFVERVLPASVMRALTDEEMAVYRRPYLERGEARRPTLSWPREIPLDGEPADVVEIVKSYATWMAANTIPKLFLNTEPGAILVGAQREFCRSWAEQAEVTVRGIHFVQEDSPREIAAALANWIAAMRCPA